MSVEALPVGYRCNLGCTYCYQNPLRDAGNFGPELDLEAVKAAALAAGAPISIFGGEALLTPLDVLEDLFAFSVEHFTEYARKNSTSAVAIQTNGVLLNDAHVALFKKYRVGVGFSIDGPGELNLARWAGSLQKTNAATEKSLAALHRCLKEGIGPSLIVTLHAGNARGDRLGRLLEWFHELDGRGLYSSRLHALEVDDEQIRDELALSAEELLEAYVAIAGLKLRNLSFVEFKDLENLLLGTDGSATCIWGACDPLSTAAVQGIAADGSLQNCGRTADAGVAWRKSETVGYERQLALYTTPQSKGGCQGCEFWIMCKGQCPGTAIDNDWRNRTEHCQTWKDLFGLVRTRLEAEGRPTLASPSRKRERHDLEVRLFNVWAQGGNMNIATALAGGEPSFGGNHGDKPHGDHHGDHGDVVDADYFVGAPQVQTGHGDGHGDHTDAARPVHGDEPHGDHADNTHPLHGDIPHGDKPHGDVGHGDATHGDSGKAGQRSNPLIVEIRRPT